MVESGFLPNDIPHVVHFTQTDPDEPKNGEDKTNNGDRFSSAGVHGPGYITVPGERQWRDGAW
jgi:hypothetical protein